MSQKYFQVTSFQSLATIHNNKDYNNRFSGPPGVYFWGFTLRPDAQLPMKEDELIIYYIGKREPGAKFSLKSPLVRENVFERIMQGVTRHFGGFGTIIDKNYMLRHSFNAKIKELEKDKKSNDVLYSVDGLHTLPIFFADNNIQNTVSWMKERLIFCYIKFKKNRQPKLLQLCKNEIKKLENEMHHIVLANVLGGAQIKNENQKLSVNSTKETSYFNSKIDWKENEILKEWLRQVNNKICFASDENDRGNKI